MVCKFRKEGAGDYTASSEFEQKRSKYLHRIFSVRNIREVCMEKISTQDFRFLDSKTYRRKEHFEYFSGLAYPYVGLTVNVDITKLQDRIRADRLPFFLTICYCVSRAANRVPEFRQRILDGKIAEFVRCKTSHTVALENGTYCYCTLEDDMPFAEYIVYASSAQEEAKRQGSIAEAEEDIYDKFFISTLPWVSYTSLIQPEPVPANCNPRITCRGNRRCCRCRCCAIMRWWMDGISGISTGIWRRRCPGSQGNKNYKNYCLKMKKKSCKNTYFIASGSFSFFVDH